MYFSDGKFWKIFKEDKKLFYSFYCYWLWQIGYRKITDKKLRPKHYAGRTVLSAEAGNEVMEKHSLDLCTVCRCDVQVKGLDRMISALSRLKKEGLLGNVHWHLIGGGDDFLMVRRMVDEENLSDNVTMYGSMDNPLTLLSQADMFVLTSRYEGKPVSVVEAQVLGVPCFVTAFASAPEQVTDGVNGMICENSTDGVYRGLKYIVSNISVVEKFRKELSENICDNSTEVQKLYNFWKNKI